MWFNELDFCTSGENSWGGLEAARGTDTFVTTFL